MGSVAALEFPVRWADTFVLNCTALPLGAHESLEARDPLNTGLQM